MTVPSAFLTTMYRRALSKLRDKYSPNTKEYQAYDEAICNIPIPSQTTLGTVVWGERTIVNKHLSDVAIIKCNPGLICRNFLGDDIPFSQFDPALMFGNLHVRRLVRKPAAGLEVFKYGSTTKYTRGNLSGPKIVYWSDGRIKTSEFVVSSDAPAFASSGDSGAWILHKDSSSSKDTDASLGVVGMLHSYDGERRELGLYTPMPRILERLEEVTHVRWGVVGIADEDDSYTIGGSDSSEEDEVSGNTDGE